MGRALFAFDQPLCRIQGGKKQGLQLGRSTTGAMGDGRKWGDPLSPEQGVGIVPLPLLLSLSLRLLLGGQDSVAGVYVLLLPLPLLLSLLLTILPNPRAIGPIHPDHPDYRGVRFELIHLRFIASRVPM